MMNTNRTLKLTTLALCGVINIQSLCSDLLLASFRDCSPYSIPA